MDLRGDLNGQIQSYLTSIIVVSGLLTTSTYPGVYTTQAAKNGTDPTGSRLAVAFRTSNAISFILSLIAITISFFLSYRLITLREYRVLEHVSAHRWISKSLNWALYSMLGSMTSSLLALAFVSKSLQYGFTFGAIIILSAVAALVVLFAFFFKSPLKDVKVQELKSLVGLAEGKVLTAWHAADRAQRLLDRIKHHVPETPADHPDEKHDLLISGAERALTEAEEGKVEALANLFKAHADTLKKEDKILLDLSTFLDGLEGLARSTDMKDHVGLSSVVHHQITVTEDIIPERRDQGDLQASSSETTTLPTSATEKIGKDSRISEAPHQEEKHQEEVRGTVAVGKPSTTIVEEPSTTIVHEPSPAIVELPPLSTVQVPQEVTFHHKYGLDALILLTSISTGFVLLGTIMLGIGSVGNTSVVVAIMGSVLCTLGSLSSVGIFSSKARVLQELSRTTGIVHEDRRHQLSLARNVVLLESLAFTLSLNSLIFASLRATSRIRYNQWLVLPMALLIAVTVILRVSISIAYRPVSFRGSNASARDGR